MVVTLAGMCVDHARLVGQLLHDVFGRLCFARPGLTGDYHRLRRGVLGHVPITILSKVLNMWFPFVSLLESNLLERSAHFVVIDCVFGSVGLKIRHDVEWVDSDHDGIPDHGVYLVVVEPAADGVQQGVFVQGLQVEQVGQGVGRAVEH